MPAPQRNAVANRSGAANIAAAAENVATVQRASILSRVASRFNMDPDGFAKTLRSTVFKGANNEEFAALLVVADAYGLNPLLKEMYAFPQKGGGIVPLVSIDGWIRIMNDHPQFDGVEFTDIADDDGKLIAIETVIYRKDRTRPIRVTEYLEECKRKTEPWDKSPARMLRHRSLIQCNRIAFGFSGIYTDDEVVGDVRLGGDLAPAPMRTVTAALPAEAFDPDTGEVSREGPADDQRGEEHRDPVTGMEIDPQEAVALDIIARAKAIELLADYNTLAAEAQPHIDAMSDEDMAGECNKALRAARQRVTGKA